MKTRKIFPLVIESESSDAVSAGKHSLSLVTLDACPRRVLNWGWSASRLEKVEGRHHCFCKPRAAGVEEAAKSRHHYCYYCCWYCQIAPTDRRRFHCHHRHHQHHHRDYQNHLIESGRARHR
jgi:hypothetical protein